VDENVFKQSLEPDTLIVCDITWEGPVAYLVNEAFELPGPSMTKWGTLRKAYSQLRLLSDQNTRPPNEVGNVIEKGSVK